MVDTGLKIIHVKLAKKKGVNRVWQTHGNWEWLYNYTPTELSEIADAGAYIELTANFAKAQPITEAMNHGSDYTAAIMKEVGPHRCTMGTDLGTVGRGNPIDGMRIFIHEMMIMQGIKREDIDTMAKKNPAFLMGLE